MKSAAFRLGLFTFGVFIRSALALLAFIGVTNGAAMAEPLKPGASVAFVGVTFIDTSLEGASYGPRDDETARLAMVIDYVAGQFVERGFTLVDIAPVAGELDRVANPADCNGCEVRAAQRLGADYSLVGQVQKVSNLILSIKLVLRHADTGAFARGMSVDIRGNTDTSWRRGMRYILRNNIFRD